MPRDSDAWPDEPDESDPEDRWGDPENDLVNVPSVGGEGDEDDDGDEQPVEIDSELASTFWAVVVLVNVGVAGVSLGAMFAYFRGNFLLGGGAAVVGVLALVRAYYSYRGYKAGDAADADETDSDG
ncbi:hypothetical protein [Halogeometricum sp. CBA1124]|uniref:DUF7322 domain-containing protein n=1 Tax=Halogeometricum sp. CBA1124 TaxID=2668071 RepID=UPI00142AF6FB|nr:hypothetical protein [Halogeometricum sp. CBA1124]MUV58183.1 hypothetical protein [Halogeometricum sp. CBA1124]